MVVSFTVSYDDVVISQDFEENYYYSWTIDHEFGYFDVRRVYCVEVGSGIDARFSDADSGWEIVVSPGSNVVNIPKTIGRIRPKLQVRCADRECPAGLAGRTNFEITGFRLDPVSLLDDFIIRFWSQREGVRIAQLESILRQIQLNWLDWYDRVDQGHPVFEIETEDLKRQCERAATITAELYSIGATDYREWFDVCDEP